MSLTISALAHISAEPPGMSETSPATTVWRDGDQPVAYGTTRGDWHWLRVIGAGSYRFPVRFTEGVIACGVVAEAGARPEVIVDCHYRTVVPLALQAYGYEVLHGSAVAMAGGVFALCAERGTGKSTIAFALQQRGHGVLADDAVVVSVPAAGEMRRPTVEPLPFALRLRAPSASHFGAPGKEEVLVGAGKESALAQAIPLAAIVLMARHDGPLELVRLGAREAFTRLLGQSYAFSPHDKARKRAMLASYMRVVNLVPTYRLDLPAGLEHLDGICRALEGLATGPVAAPSAPARDSR